MLLNTEPCHPLYNRTADFVFFQCKDPNTLSNDKGLDIVGKHNSERLMFIHRVLPDFFPLKASALSCLEKSRRTVLSLSLSREPCNGCAARYLCFPKISKPSVGECFGISTLKKYKIHCLIIKSVTQLYIQQQPSVFKVGTMVKGWCAAVW